MTNLPKILAEKVKLELGRKNFSQRDLAKRANVSHGTIARFLASPDDLRLSTLEGISKALGMAPHELIDPNIDSKSVEDRLAALEAKVSAKPSNLVEKLVAVAQRAHDEDVENVIHLLEDLIAHYEPAHKKDTA